MDKMSNHYQRHTLNKLFNLFLYIRNQPRNIKKPIYMKDKYLLRISFLYYLRIYNWPLNDHLKKEHLKEFI